MGWRKSTSSKPDRLQVKVEDVENYVITIEQATSPQFRRARWALTKPLTSIWASIRVYSEYDEEAIYAETGCQMKASSKLI